MCAWISALALEREFLSGCCCGLGLVVKAAITVTRESFTHVFRLAVEYLKGFLN